MFYTVYRITNKVNGKTYIGKHQTTNLLDGYMGSGKLLGRAMKKYGVDNFDKEILYVFETEEEMNAKEKELVVLDETSYNLCPGGQGGFGYINSQGLTTPISHLNAKRLEKFSSNAEFCAIFSELSKRGYDKERLEEGRKEKCPNGTFFGRNHTEETKRIMSSKAKGRVPWNKGKPRTEEEKQKIREGVLRTQKPS